MIFSDTQLDKIEIRGKKQMRYGGMERDVVNNWSALHVPYSDKLISEIEHKPKTEAERLKEILEGKNE